MVPSLELFKEDLLESERCVNCLKETKRISLSEQKIAGEFREVRIVQTY